MQPMTRSASQPQDDALQGNLFGAPEPAGPTALVRQQEATSHDLSDAELSGAVLTGVIRPDPILDPRIAELEAQLAAAIADRDARPTQAAYDTVVADRDARPTLAEVQDARVGSIILSKDWESGEVSLCFGLQKTEDFVTWEAFEGGTWSEAPNGEFKLTLPLGEAKKWLRLTLPE